MTGKQIVELGNSHIGESYILGATVPKNNTTWRGPWDCAEFISWIVFQLSDKLYGCNNNLGNPPTADAYTGYNAENIGKIISIQQAIKMAEAAILRVAAKGLTGHIVISDGKGGTVEAHSYADGVINSVINGRRWDYGILVPWFTSDSLAQIQYIPPDYIIYRYTLPMMISPQVGESQRALKGAGFDPNGSNNAFGTDTLKAVEAFQQANNLVVDG